MPSDKTLDTRTLLYERLSDAARMAGAYGCRVRVTLRDGRRLEGPKAAPRVIDVALRHGRVVEILSVGEPDPAP